MDNLSSPELLVRNDPLVLGKTDSGPASRPAVPWQIELFRDSWKQVMYWTGIGLLIFVAISFLIPSRYEAVARLMPPDQAGNSTALMSALMAKGGDLLTGLTADVLGARSPGATVVGVLNSRTVQDALINQFDLRAVYGKKRYEDARKVLEGRSSISEDKKSGIITIAVQDRDPRRAADLARAYVDNLNSRVARLTTSSAHRERVFLEERIQGVQKELSEATLKLSEFSSKNRTLDPQIQAKAMLESAANLEGQLIAAETELSGLRQIYGPENTRVKATSARIGELRSKLQSMSGDPTVNSNGATTLSDGELYPSIQQLPLLGNVYYELARRARVDEALYEVLMKQYELAKVQEAKEIPSIKVLDEPVIPERRSFPPRLLIIAAGTLLSLLFAIAWVVVGEVWQKLDDSDPVKIGARELRASFVLGARQPIEKTGS
jgi:capsule polysaccharide export protein KpsE/RkpR